MSYNCEHGVIGGDEYSCQECAKRDSVELATLRQKLAEAEKERDALMADAHQGRVIRHVLMEHGCTSDSDCVHVPTLVNDFLKGLVAARDKARAELLAMVKASDGNYYQAVANAKANDDLRAALATAEADCAVMRAFAKAHEKWEANLINSNEAWAPDGMAEFPRLTAPLYDEFMEVQRLRNAALARINGQSIMDELSAARKVCEIAQWQENGGMWPENYADALDAYRAARKANTGANNGKL